MASSLPRPKRHLSDIAKRYPGVWRQVDMMRSERGKSLPNWPNWCFLPLAGAYAIVSKGSDIPFELVGDVARLGALAAWRVTQGIYRFDPALFRALWDTPIEGEIPRDVLYRLPEWCVYIETPGSTALEKPLHGFFAHLEHDMNYERTELRFLLDTGDTLADLIPIPLHLVRGGITESLQAMTEETSRHIRKHGLDVREYILDTRVEEHLTPQMSPLVSLVLYLCSQAAEYVGNRRPAYPRPTRTKKGERLFPPHEPTVWNTGFRIGAALRKAENERHLGTTLERRSPRGHIRRAHWKTYWTGPKTQPQTPVLRWLPPTPVNIGGIDHINPTIRSVKPRKEGRT